MTGGSEAKKHKASETKLRKQREKGSVASSQESSGFLASALGIALLLGSAGPIWEKMRLMIEISLEQINLPFDAAREASLIALGQAVLVMILPVLGISIATAFLTAVIYNKGLIFAMKPITPQMSRVSPSSGFKRIYGRRGLIETPISTVRICLWLGFAVLVGFWPVVEFASNWVCEGACLANRLVPVFRILIIGAFVLLLLAAGVDMIFQRKLFFYEQKMTETERKNERKDQFGAPEIRQERRRRMREMDQPQRKPDLDNATMCFFFDDAAIAIEFRPPEVALPYVMAKAETALESHHLRTRVTGGGWPEQEHEGLTRSGLSTASGDVLSEQTFSSFIKAVEKMFLQ
ncbi:EscU/YscU/HrcU family type III secretion system export apparatus switch protein [uncultured Roseobacter sp.]|uniref:EscU/YscU/HrcU family type III secretion system export apparatus switch protein n=1 Tax=uncultured Roseobacter sp. TaxID=114847 RepID=UPI00261B3837|nr:EscU/YscU/HrcU family type III secretion system export apparatus switch protein [uncultured Roseobacter sp.]